MRAQADGPRAGAGGRLDVDGGGAIRELDGAAGNDQDVVFARQLDVNVHT